MTADVELLPCPFCGKSNHDRWPCEWLDDTGANVIRCAWCHGAAPAKTWNRRTPPPSAPVGVAYLDIGVGGYMDLGTEMSDEELAKLPNGRHVLGIIGTHGVDGYTLARQPAAEAQPVAFDRKFADMLIEVIGDVQDELGFTDEDKLCANGSAEIIAAIRDLKERANTAPPSAPVGVGATRLVPPEWISEQGGGADG